MMITKGQRRLWWISLIWGLLSMSQATKIQPQPPVSAILFLTFVPILALWGISILFKYFKQPKTERSSKGFLIWINLVLCFYLAFQYLVFNGK